MAATTEPMSLSTGMEYMISNLSTHATREELRNIYADNGVAARTLEKRLLIKGKEVV
jgi:hypothetical protein